MRRWVAALALGAVAVAVGCLYADRRAADGVFDRGAPADRWAAEVADALAGYAPTAGGAESFDGEQEVITCALGTLGLAVVAGDDPERIARYRPGATACAAFLASPGARRFGVTQWGEDPVTTTRRGGHAYLGWLAVGLVAASRLDPSVDAARLVDPLVSALALGPTGFETYPGEVYPTDQAAALAAVALDGRHPGAVDRFARAWREVAIDPTTGLQHQRLQVGTGAPLDGPRGSGTTISAYFLGFVDRDLSRALAEAARAELRGEVFGLGGVREVPRGAPFRMDIDSGPVVPGFGFGVAATGFGMSTARILDDRPFHRQCLRTASLFGLRGRGWFWAGGTLGNAVLLAAATGPGPLAAP